MFYFGWCDEADAFSSTFHVEDESIYAFRLTQDEGEFASLEIVIRRPSVPVLDASRQQWCWFSWNDGSAVHALFHGRVIGVPKQLNNELITLQFLAAPSDFTAQKEALAATLRVAPFWDAMWIEETQRNDPDVVLESRSQLWHTDRLTHVLTASDIIVGEDGTIDVDESHFYDDFDISYSQAPATKVHFEATAEFTQVNLGTIDIASAIPTIKTMTPEGLLKGWPESGAKIGSSWELKECSIVFRGETLTSKASKVTGDALVSDQLASLLSAIRDITMMDPREFIKTASDDIWSEFEYIFGDRQNALWLFGNQFGGSRFGWGDGWSSAPVSGTSYSFSYYMASGAGGGLLNNWGLGFGTSDPYSSVATGDGGRVYIWGENIRTSKFLIGYNIERQYAEKVVFDLVGDVQSMAIDIDGSRVIKVEARSAADVAPAPGEPIPIQDFSQNKFFQTARGHEAVQYLLCVARAKLLATCRCVDIEAQMPFSYAPNITLRKNMLLSDARLPTGVAGGKIKSYEFSLDGASGEMVCSVVVGATVGNATAIEISNDGEDDYTEGDYAEDDYTFRNGLIHQITSDLGYGDFSNISIADDGIDFSQLTPSDLVIAVDVTFPFDVQKSIIDLLDGRYFKWTGIAQEMNAIYTEVELRMKEVDGLQFATDLSVTPTTLIVPKTIDLGG